jgi:hypothetical protein
MIFIYNLCQELDLDKKDVLAMFQELRLMDQYVDPSIDEKTGRSSPLQMDGIIPTENERFVLEKVFEHTNISKLDIRRMYRYLDKNIKKDSLKLSALDDEFDEEFLE